MHFSAIWMALSGRPPYRYSLPIMYRVREPHGTGFSGSLATASSQRRKELEKAARRSWAWYKSKGMASTHAAIAARSGNALSVATTAIRIPGAPKATNAETFRTIQPADHVWRKSTRISIDIARVSGQSHSARYLKNSPA